MGQWIYVLSKGRGEDLCRVLDQFYKGNDEGLTVEDRDHQERVLRSIPRSFHSVKSSDSRTDSKERRVPFPGSHIYMAGKVVG